MKQSDYPLLISFSSSVP